MSGYAKESRALVRYCYCFRVGEERSPSLACFAALFRSLTEKHTDTEQKEGRKEPHQTVLSYNGHARTVAFAFSLARHDKTYGVTAGY